MCRFLFRLFRSVLAISLVWCVLIEIAEAFSIRTFGMELDGDWFLLIAISSADELRRFFVSYGVTLALLALAVVAVSTLLAVLVFRLRGSSFALLLACCAAFVVVAACRTGSLFAWKPVYVAYDTFRSAAEYSELIRAGRWSDAHAAESGPAAPGATNLVFVIGESLTSDRMSLYGYAKPTTPRLAALGERLAVLGPIEAIYPDTARELRMILTRATRAAREAAIETMPVAFRRRGYRTVLVSAQGHWERYCGVEQMIFAACETRRYVSDDAALREAVLDEFKAQEGDRRPVAVFAHMIGSHFEPGDRVPPGFAEGEGLDDYDRSVRYTDEVLSGLIERLPPRTALVFVSDHGESVDCAGWRDQRSASLWRVPLLVFPADCSERFQGVHDVGEIWYTMFR